MRCVISNNNDVLARRSWEVVLFQTDDDGVVRGPACISVDRFRRETGESCTLSTSFGATQVRVVLRQLVLAQRR